MTAPHGPREALNELRWRAGSLEGVEVTYVHRGAPGDVASFAGADVVGLHRSFVEIAAGAATTMIPYHRVLRIRRAGETVWERR